MKGNAYARLFYERKYESNLICKYNINLNGFPWSIREEDKKREVAISKFKCSRIFSKIALQTCSITIQKSSISKREGDGSL